MRFSFHQKTGLLPRPRSGGGQQRIPFTVNVILFFLLVSGLFVATAHADEVFMQNGDRIHGEVISMGSEELLFRTAYAGDITINWKYVSRLSTDKPIEVELQDNVILRGRAIQSQREGELTIQPSEAPATAPIPMAHVMGLQPYVEERGWEVEANAALGIGRATGNTRNEKINFTGEAKFTKRPDSFNLYGEAWYESESGDTTKDRDLVSLEYRRDVSGKWYISGNSLDTRDEFKDLRYFLSANMGVGYDFWRSPVKNLSFDLGPGYVSEEYKNPQANFGFQDSREYVAAVGRLNADKWFFDRFFQGYYRIWWIQSLQSSDVWKIYNRIGVRIPLRKHMFADLRYGFDYDNSPADNTDRLDTQLTIGLGLEY